jgi:hypothetical protein
MRRLFEAVARRRPLVVAIEDGPLREGTLLDLLEYVVSFSRGRRSSCSAWRAAT